MKRYLRLALLLAAPILCQCTRTVYHPVETQHTETVVVRDTTIVVTTAGSTAHNTTLDTLSYLCNDYASSRASVEKGILHHSLNLFPRTDSVRVQLHEVHITDSIPYLVEVPGESVEVTPRWVSWLVAIVAFLVVVWVISVGVRAIKK